MSIHWFGYVGTALVIVAYLPQITHLIREKCSAGISFGAYAIWVVAAVLLLTATQSSWRFKATRSSRLASFASTPSALSTTFAKSTAAPPRWSLRLTRPVLDHEGR
ncbi:MAG: PQ-loop repeat-containing protein [Gammaproteobacteria bacterium]